MLNDIFSGIFTQNETVISVSDFLLCIAVSIIAGIIFAAVYTFKSRYT